MYRRAVAVIITCYFLIFLCVLLDKLIQGAAFNSGAKQRIIRMVEAQVDPMEPPKFKTNKKIPRGPPSPPAPVMHSPSR